MCCYTDRESVALDHVGWVGGGLCTMDTHGFDSSRCSSINLMVSVDIFLEVLVSPVLSTLGSSTGRDLRRISLVWFNLYLPVTHTIGLACM